MPRHEGNSHRGPSHRRKCGHVMRSNATRKPSALKKLTSAQRPIQQAREEDYRNERHPVGASAHQAEAVRQAAPDPLVA